MQVVLNSIFGFMFSLLGEPSQEIGPPRVDYCSRMEQEIQGRKHGFLAGNKTYYMGGFYAVWNPVEDETIGLTHPFHNDLRCRGRGMVSHPDTGFGHDLSGWEFHKHTRVAYGTVIIGESRYEHPSPTSMIWRPDRMICEYVVAGVRVREEKYIALNDVACSIITSDQPIRLEFAGQSFADDQTGIRSADCELDAANNCVRVTEGGVSEARPVQDVVTTGPLMYDGMSTVISSSRSLENYVQNEEDGLHRYSFELPCDSNSVALAWAMNDDYAIALSHVNDVLADPNEAMVSKTRYMNDLLNDQIPYFRCSDSDVVDVYYYLWALQLMYNIDVGEGFERYPHTQTAVNNFLGIHRFDANFQIQVGAWAADKQTFANGNALVWKALLPFADLETGRLPADNMGKAWYSGLWGPFTAHAVGAWKIYQHSGDKEFLAEAYAFYRSLMWSNVPGIWGYQYTAAGCLANMARELESPAEEIDHWNQLVRRDDIDVWLNNLWQKNGVTNYFNAGSPTNRLGWSTFAYLALDDFPREWARDMVDYWAMDGTNGFNFNGHLSTTALKSWDLVPNKNFMVTPDSAWFALRGMYKQHLTEQANELTLFHLKNYNMRWGIPIAPEAMTETLDLHGDAYSNFNAGKILLILEGIFGLSYSIPDDTFTVADKMPPEWDFMETYVPIREDETTRWTRVRVDREVENGVISKRVRVEGNHRTKLRVEPWLEGRALRGATPGGSANAVSGHWDYEFYHQNARSIRVMLAE